MFKLSARSRLFKPHDIALAVLLAGCVPTVLMAFISYSILKSTLESKIVTDRGTLVQSLARLVNAELTRTGETMEYYQALPLTQRMVLRPFGDPGVQDWLAEIFYSHPRIDGMFVTDAAGKLIASIPATAEGIGRNFPSEEWLKGAQETSGAYVSTVTPRVQDGRLCAVIATAVRTHTGETIGYIGATILVERIGRRLAAMNFGEGSVVQVIDQNGVPLFDKNLQPNTGTRAADMRLLKLVHDNKDKHTVLGEDIVTFEPVEGVPWTAILEQPSAIAYRPVRDLVEKTTLNAAWLVAFSALAAWLMSRFYRQGLVANERIARETFFKETILANMPIGIALVDPATKQFLQTNGKFIEMAREFGGAPAERAIESLADVRLIGIEEVFEKVASSGVPFEARELRVTAPGGGVHFLTVNLLRLQDAERRTHGILFLLADQTADITIRKELIAANTAKDQFLALLSHELRNPLSPVITMVHELEKLAGEDARYRGPLEIIRRNVELEARLIDDLLDITRIAHGKLQLTPEIINAHRAIHRALEICQKDIHSKDLAVIVDLQADEHHVKADPARFQQVLWNLIKNAVKFTEKGSITIRSKNTERRRLVVEVIDTGIGMEPERIGKIFNAFEQGESSITRRFGGLGLGLAISKAMIEAHGGKLTAHSEGKGCGSRFCVELDTVDAPTTADEDSTKTPTLAGVSLQHKILLVDDHEDTCLGMKLLLERRGYRVKIAHSVQGGFDLASREKFNLVISDLGLPDGSGFDLLEKLRAAGNSIPAVALSGFGMESDIEHSRTAGFSEHLIKPVNIERLDAILKKMFPG